MTDSVSTVLEITQGLRRAQGLGQLTPGARAAFVRDLDRLDAALTSRRYGYAPGTDPYAQALDITDLEQKLRGTPPPQQQGAAPPAAPPPPAVKQTAEIGQRAAAALQAIDFPGFVSSLLTGTFQAIVDSSAKQVRSYAELVASLSQTLEDFSSDNVSEDQARERLAQQYPKDLVLTFPAPGVQGSPKLLPRGDAEGTSPDWLKKYGLDGEELTADLTDGPLVTAGRKQVGEDRMQTLATMVLMGINRVVVNDGEVTAKLQFHAQAVDQQIVAVGRDSMGIAGSSASTDANAQMLVSTVKVNAQADAAIRADLMGQVRVSFKTETFPLERFADSAAIQLINRHARWQSPEQKQQAQPAAAAAPAATAPTPAAPGGTGEHR